MEQSFEMASARAVTCGNYLAIGDIGSNQIRIFDQTGQVGSIVTSYPILDLDVASQGVVSFIMTENGANYISLYSSNGEELVDIRTSISDMAILWILLCLRTEKAGSQLFKRSRRHNVH